MLMTLSFADMPSNYTTQSNTLVFRISINQLPDQWHTSVSFRLTAVGKIYVELRNKKLKFSQYL